MKLQAKVHALVVACSVCAVATSAFADKLDDIISSGELKCGVMLDYPPNGFRDANNNPAGYDVDYCRDMAKALGVDAMIVETSSPDRIPALLSKRVDLSVASASITLERAKTVAFSQPYSSYSFVVMARKDSGIRSFSDLKGKKVGSVKGTTEDILFQEHFKQWDDPSGKYLTLTTDSDRNLALAQGKIDAFIVNIQSANELQKLPQFADFHTCCDAPFPKDTVGIMLGRQDESMIRWVNLFVLNQQESGRYAELYKKWYSAEAPQLSKY